MSQVWGVCIGSAKQGLQGLWGLQVFSESEDGRAQGGEDRRKTPTVDMSSKEINLPFPDLPSSIVTGIVGWAREARLG